jgi:hypothetical protein
MRVGACPQCAARVSDMWREHRDTDLLTMTFCPECARAIALFCLTIRGGRPSPDNLN